MSCYEMVSELDKVILNNVLNTKKFEWINSYDIKIMMFYKCGKYDKNGDLKSPAIQKNGHSVPAQIKIVSSFNRITDNIDVKIIINKEYWDELLNNERESVIDHYLSYLEVKTDKIGEPLTISDDCDKVQLKLKKPDFYCEGFIDLVSSYGKFYIPWQEAKKIKELYNEK